MRLLRSLLVLGCAVALAACGGPSAPLPPESPSADAVTPGVAARGDTVTVTGTSFGDEGSLTIGGAEAAIVSWTDTEIEATVPAEAAGAWQDVVVSTEGGTATVGGLFVGVEYEGDGAGLQDFLLAQEAGADVLLQAEEYVLPVDALLLVDNVSLYGRGRDETSIAAQAMAAFVDFGNAVTLRDLTFEGDAFINVVGTAPEGGLVAASVLEAAPTDLGAAARAAAAELALAPADVPSRPALTLEGFGFVEVNGGQYFGLPIPIGLNMDLTVRDAVIAGENTMVMLLVGGDLEIEGSSFTADEFAAVALSGALSLLDSDVESASSVTVASDLGLDVTGSTLRALNGDVQVVGAASAVLVGSGIMTASGPISVAGSTLVAEDADITDPDDLGAIEIQALAAPVAVTDNVLISADNGISVMSESYLTASNVTFSDNADVRTGVADPVDALTGGLDFFVAGAMSVPNLAIERNGITSVSGIAIESDGAPLDLRFVDNVLSLGSVDFDGYLDVYAYGGGDLDVSGNSGVIWTGSLYVSGDAESVLTVEGNDLEFREAQNAALELEDIGSVTVTDNVLTAVGGGGNGGLYLRSIDDDVALVATGNTFAGWENALFFENVGVTPNTFDVAVTGNVFDMEFTAAPQVAELYSVADAIDARNNQWGDVTDVAVLEGYVLLSGDTGVLGGSLLLDPVGLP